jgi:3',5'-nucleoside bisphosphate phosphatase
MILCDVARAYSLPGSDFMLNDLVDLHLHSTFSDGLLTPTELVDKAVAIGLRAIAIADHDNVDGVPEAMAAGRLAGIEIVSGVELSVVWRNHQDIHLLGYDFDPYHGPLCRSLAEFRTFRANRSRRILDKVNAQLIQQKQPPLDFVEVAALAGGTMGRPHIGQALVNAGHVPSMEAAFQRYLVPCNVPKRYFPVDEAIEMLHAAGGCAVLAHPPFIKVSEKELEALVDEFIAMGLDGLEVYNSGADNATIDRHLTLARRRDLLVTGGSDFHRDQPGGTELGRGLGNLRISYQTVEEIRARAAGYRTR